MEGRSFLPEFVHCLYVEQVAETKMADRNRCKSMPDEHDLKSSHPTVYQIKLEGHLDREWTGWFEGLTITLTDDGSTLLCGEVKDQAALHGLFRKVSSSGLTIISVSPHAKGV